MAYGRILVDTVTEDTPQGKTATMRISNAPETELYVKLSNGLEKKLTGVSQVSNEEFSNLWQGVTNIAASQGALYNLLEAKYGRVFFFSNVTPQPLTGEVGNINRPYPTSEFVSVVNSASPGDTFIVLNSTFNTTSPVLPKKDQSFILVNSTWNNSGINGNIQCLNSAADTVNRAENVRFVGIGNSKINKNNTDLSWGFLAPWAYCQVYFENLEINSYGNLQNMVTIDSYIVSFKNCKYTIVDNNITTGDTGGGMTSGITIFRNCEVIGLLCLSSGGSIFGPGGSVYGYKIVAIDTKFTANNPASSAFKGNISFFANSNVTGADAYFRNCDFSSPEWNIINRTDTPAFINNSVIILDGCNFVNNADGYIENEVDNNQKIKVKNSYSKNAASGIAMSDEYLTSITIEPELQVF